MHNFTVSAQNIFTFRRLSAFTVSFIGTLQVLMQIIKHVALSYWLVKCLWYRVSNQKVGISFILDVPRPLSNVLRIIIFKRLVRNAYTEPVCLERLRASK